MSAIKQSLTGLLAASLPIFAIGDTGLENNSPPVSGLCFNVSRIHNTEVLDNQHILFEIAGGEKYLNTLPQRCGGLNTTSALSYRESIHKLCDLDIVTALESIGGEYTAGPSCGLGPFSPISDEELNTLRQQINAEQTAKAG